MPSIALPRQACPVRRPAPSSTPQPPTVAALPPAATHLMVGHILGGVPHRQDAALLGGIPPRVESELEVGVKAGALLHPLAHILQSARQAAWGRVLCTGSVHRRGQMPQPHPRSTPQHTDRQPSKQTADSSSPARTSSCCSGVSKVVLLGKILLWSLLASQGTMSVTLRALSRAR